MDPLFDPMVLGMSHGAITIAVIFIIGIPLIAIVGIIWYVQRM